MIGAIAGDIVGSRFEWHPLKSTEFELFAANCFFTDDTALTIATAEALLGDRDFGAAYQRWGNRYPNAGYGKAFQAWLTSDKPQPYGSWGNGSAMRVSPVAWLATSEDEVLDLAKDTAIPTHNHERGIIGAQAVALATWLGGHEVDPELIRRKVMMISGYDLERSVADIRPGYQFDVSCDGSVPEAIICGLEATSWEDAVRLAVSLGGDADTQAAIAGGIASFRFAEERTLWWKLGRYLPDEMLRVLQTYTRHQHW